MCLLRRCRSQRIATVQERLPFLEPSRRCLKLDSGAPARSSWPREQLHAALLRKRSTLLQVAFAARGHEVVPGTTTTARPGHDVVEVQIADCRTASAILALVAVA